MTVATKITVSRLFLVPVFGFCAVMYGIGMGAGEPQEAWRWAAFWVFFVAAASDGIDGWIARRFNQISEQGAFLDPIADKSLVVSAVIILTIFPWGPDGWRIPYWFTTLVILRDSAILAGIKVMWSANRKVEYRPHWTGKICTFSLFLVIGWVMLRPLPLPPVYPCIFAAGFLAWSMAEYIRQGLRVMRA